MCRTISFVSKYVCLCAIEWKCIILSENNYGAESKDVPAKDKVFQFIYVCVLLVGNERERVFLYLESILRFI